MLVARGPPAWARFIIRPLLGCCRRCLAQSDGQAFPVRTLPSASLGVQPMRPWPTLLRSRVRGQHPIESATRGRKALSARSRRATQTCSPHAPVAQAPRRLSKDSDASRFPVHPCRCCTTGQRITPGNLARFTAPIAMQPYRLRVHCAQRHRQHQQRSSRTSLALPLVPVTMSGAGAPGLSAPQPVVA